MTDQLIHLFSSLGMWAIGLSILANTIANLIGFIPSIIITSANVWVWGPWRGGFLSWVGEMIGSTLSFYLYRFGMKKVGIRRHHHWKWVNALNEMTPSQQWVSIFLGRISPFIPSGVINVVGALTTISSSIFLSATAVSKILSISFEVLIAYGFFQVNETYIRVIVLIIVVVAVAIWMWRGKKK